MEQGYAYYWGVRRLVLILDMRCAHNIINVIGLIRSASGGGIAGIAELDRPSILGMGSAFGGGGDELDNFYLSIIQGIRL